MGNTKKKGGREGESTPSSWQGREILDEHPLHCSRQMLDEHPRTAADGCWMSIPALQWMDAGQASPALQQMDAGQASSTLQQEVPLYIPGVTSSGPSCPPCQLFLLVMLVVLAGARCDLRQMLQHDLADRFGA